MEIKDNEEILKTAREGRRHITLNNKIFSLLLRPDSSTDSLKEIMEAKRQLYVIFKVLKKRIISLEFYTLQKHFPQQ